MVHKSCRVREDSFLHVFAVWLGLEVVFGKSLKWFGMEENLKRHGCWGRTSCLLCTVEVGKEPYIALGSGRMTAPSSTLLHYILDWLSSRQLSFLSILFSTCYVQRRQLAKSLFEIVWSVISHKYSESKLMQLQKKWCVKKKIQIHFLNWVFWVD